MNLRSGEKGKFSRTYYTSVTELKQNHARIYSKVPSTITVHRDIGHGKYVLAETIYREPLNYRHTGQNLAKLLAKLLTIYTDGEGWELCKLLLNVRWPFFFLGTI
jgi:hypothetical protein